MTRLKDIGDAVAQIDPVHVGIPCDAAIEACDRLDGVQDSVITYLGQCHFQGGPSGASTITKEIAELVASMCNGPGLLKGDSSSAACATILYVCEGLPMCR
jgi:hypothetical protein